VRDADIITHFTTSICLPADSKWFPVSPLFPSGFHERSCRWPYQVHRKALIILQCHFPPLHPRSRGLSTRLEAKQEPCKAMHLVSTACFHQVCIKPHVAFALTGPLGCYCVSCSIYSKEQHIRTPIRLTLLHIIRFPPGIACTMPNEAGFSLPLHLPRYSMNKLSSRLLPHL
jgi:hypothetical protein